MSSVKVSVKLIACATSLTQHGYFYRPTDGPPDDISLSHLHTVPREELREIEGNTVENLADADRTRCRIKSLTGIS